MAVVVGTAIGPYEVLAKLGEGGMGEVYRARDTRLGRDVALKGLPASFAANAERIARFQREAQLLAALNHPNIAAIYGLEDHGITKLLVMELVEGHSLDERLKQGALPIDEAIAIAQQIGEALASAHDRGIVHRDLKPANVMLTRDGRVKVLDFGLAKMVEAEPAASGLTMSPTISMQATLAGTILGTAPYMSPEQARGRAVDKRTDVWAFGCVLFEMLTGKRAFGGDDVTETLAAIVKGEPDWAALPASVPRGIVSIIRGCLIKDARQRLADIAVPLYLLSAGSAEPADAAPVSVTIVSRWRRALPTVAAVAAAVLLTGGANWFSRPTPATPRVARFVVPYPEGQRPTNTGRQTITLSPDGRRILYIANQRLYLRDIDDIESHLVRGTDAFTGGITSPVFSPDGEEIAFWVADDSTLRRIPTAGGSAITIMTTTNPLGLRWEDQGLLFGRLSEGIFRVSPAGGAPERIVAAGPDELTSVGGSLPEGRGLLYSVRKEQDSWDSGTVMVQTATGERKVLVRNASDGRYDGAGHLLYAVAGIVMAVPFDLDRLAVSGKPVSAIEGVLHIVTGTNSGAAQFSLAADGTLVYIPGPVRSPDVGGSNVLAIFDGKGGVELLNVPRGLYRGLRVSPDGKTVAYDAGSEVGFDVWLQALDLKTASRRLTFGGQRNGGPVWSPDGQWLAFTSDRDGDTALFRQRADGTGVAERLTKPEEGVEHLAMSWSPDGGFLLLAAQKKETYDLLVLSLKDGRLSPFSDVTGSLVRTEAAFSPDGRWVVYQRDGGSSNRRDIQAFIEPFPATGAKHLLPVKSAGHPFWSRSGDRLYFNTSATTSVQVDVATTPTVMFSPPRPLSRDGRYEPSPSIVRRQIDALLDGRLLGVRIQLDDGKTTPEILVVLNWLPSLTAKLAD